MVAWWPLAALVLVPALQVPGVLVVSRYVDADPEPGWRPGYGERVEDAEPVDPWGDRCPDCGTVNAGAYDVCRACTGRLS